jgi:hypothetical protein
VKDFNSWPGVAPYGPRLYINPAVIALMRIGDAAIPALRHVLSSGSPDEHALAARTLCSINTPKEKAALRDDLQHESSPELQAMIKKRPRTRVSLSGN